VDLTVNGTTLLIGSIILLALLMVVWARGRASRIRKEARDRERRALAVVRAGGDPTASDTESGDVPGAKRESTGETIFEPGTPTGLVPGRGGIEVAEVFDIEELLRGEPLAVATRARAQLEEPTNIHTGDTLPPRPVAPAPPPPAPAVPPRVVPPPVPPRAAAPAAPAAAAAKGGRPAAQPAASAPAAPGGDVPLRELVLAWFEARGYRSSPASPVVRPIELVLRHKDDPARAYAFVVGTQRVTAERVQQLAQQARGIGLIRVLVVADAGLAPEAPSARRGVRVLDRDALTSELGKLDLSIAAKIIAVARKRSAARSTAA
jgi:hypothetical protein